MSASHRAVFAARERIMWRTLRRDVALLAPFLRWSGFDPNSHADIQGVAFAWAQVVQLGDMRRDDRYDSPIDSLHHAATRILDAISELWCECPCDDCTEREADLE